MQWMARQANPEGWRHLRHSSALLVVDDGQGHHLPFRSLTCSQVPASANEPSLSAGC